MKRIAALNVFLFFLQVICHAQHPLLDTLTKKFDAHRGQAIHEKIFIHADQDLYLTGETIWFKLYIVDASFHKPLDLSKVAYVEILNAENKQVLQSKIEITGGSGDASFFIPASLGSGTYVLRAYTNWMKNFDPDFYFHKPVTIVNPFTVPESSKPRPASIKAHFFPEGGNLVAGIKSKVAFKLTDESGLGANGTVSVVSNTNDTIVVARPLKFGLGHFYLTPAMGDQYKAIVRDGKGNVSIHAIPSAYATGCVMTVSDSAATVLVNVKHKTDGPQPSLLYLFVHARQIIVKAEAKFFQHDGAVFHLNKEDLPSGVSHFTIFNDALQPVCERLYFNRADQQDLRINIKTDQRDYDLRRKVTVHLQTSTLKKQGAPAQLSVAVYRQDSLSEINSDNISPYLWLSSDLNGRIESPGYYFDSNDPNAHLAADNLMLTHGWRRFNWDTVLDKKQFLQYLPEHRGHIIKATITNSNDSSLSGAMTYLSSPGKIIRIYGSRSNPQGETLYELKDFYGPRRIILQTTLQDNPLNLKIADPFSAKFSTAPVIPFRVGSSHGEAFLSRSISMQVQDIYYYEALAKRSATPALDSLPFYGKANKVYRLDDFTRFQSMEEVMREYVPEVFVRKRKDGFHFIMIDIAKGGVLEGDPLILLDGLPIFDYNEVVALDPLKIKKLELLNRKFYHGISTFYGIVSYTTYKGDLGGFQLDPKSVAMDYEGLQLKREFYSPVYETQRQRNERLPDQRYLLYWNPAVATASDGTAKLEFYTSDVSGNYVMVTEGITKDGFSGSGMSTFSVKRYED